MTNPSKAEMIQLHFQSLSNLAGSLNKASDELTKAVSILDEAIKKLNIGLTVWVNYASRGVEEWEFDDDQIGYCKVNGKWGIALQRFWGDHKQDSFGGEGPWLFSDAPREMRLRSVDKIPELIEALSKEAFNATRTIQEKTTEVTVLAKVVEQIAGGRDTLGNIRTPETKAKTPIKLHGGLSDLLSTDRPGSK